MKIKALRVREVARFDKPVAIEGFSGGLDVLAGPNEMGKSTLFRALRLLLGVKHTSKADAVNRLTPYAGGQPLIEADIDIAGKPWRITKRFGKGARAQLVDLDKGHVVARNTEADELLAEMLEGQASGFGAHGLVWVGQKESLEAPQPDQKGERGALMEAIESEIGAMTGSGIAEAVRRRVEAQLGELVTTRGPKKGSRYAAALERRGELQGELDVERAALAAVAQSQEELDQLQARFRDVGDAVQIAALEEKSKASAKALEEAERQRLRVRQAKDAVQFCNTEQKAAQSALADFNSRMARLAELNGGIAEDEARLPELRLAAESAQAAFEKTRTDGERLRDEEKRLQLLLRRAEISERLEAKLRVLAEAERLDREIAEETERMRSDPVTSERVDRLQRVEHQFQLIEGRISAESPTVKISYEIGARERIWANGEALADGAELHARDLIILEVPGVGRVEIAPGGGDGREDLLQRSEALSRERRELLGEVGAKTAGEALELYGERQRRDRRLNAAIAELRGLGPDGVAAIRSDVSDLENQIGLCDSAGPGEAGERTAEDLSARLQAIARDLDDARRAYPECATRQKVTAGELAEVQAGVAARRQRSEELERLLGTRENREMLADDLRSRAERADGALSEAVRTVAALEEVLPDGDELNKLNEDAQTAVRTLGEARLESGRLREAISAASARIEMAGDRGLGRRVSELEGEVERATAAVSEFEAEIDALNLLLEALDEAHKNARERLLAPLQQRVSPYLSSVFGSARARFAEDFGIEGLERDGRGVEDIRWLSEGTQEQLGLVVRLAYARLIADSGEALPVIFDDPLVYSDAERIAQMFAALRSATAHHQVVVLTCREPAFAALGGTRLELAAWKAEVDLG
ncbi:MAG: AAA family ATPase [Alphaproteobacteria bacterium]|nr:AAA family ATPase [Alphaproteobacteria bacterium]